MSSSPSSWIPTALGALVTILGVFAAPIQAFISGHPTLAAVIGGVGVIIAHLLPSPVTPGKA